MNEHDYERENDTYGPGLLLVGLLIGLLMGGLAGAVAMLLLAPQPGKKTRAKLQRQSRKLRKQTAETVEEAVTQARGTAQQITKDVRKQAKELQERGQALLDG
jgi:gas vesicle protein